jgi:hypothetical protein
MGLIDPVDLFKDVNQQEITEQQDLFASISALDEIKKHQEPYSGINISGKIRTSLLALKVKTLLDGGNWCEVEDIFDSLEKKGFGELGRLGPEIAISTFLSGEIALTKKVATKTLPALDYNACAKFAFPRVLAEVGLVSQALELSANLHKRKLLRFGILSGIAEALITDKNWELARDLIIEEEKLYGPTNLSMQNLSFVNARLMGFAELCDWIADRYRTYGRGISGLFSSTALAIADTLSLDEFEELCNLEKNLRPESKSLKKASMTILALKGDLSHNLNELTTEDVLHYSLLLLLKGRSKTAFELLGMLPKPKVYSLKWGYLMLIEHDWAGAIDQIKKDYKEARRYLRNSFWILEMISNVNNLNYQQNLQQEDLRRRRLLKTGWLLRMEKNL